MENISAGHVESFIIDKEKLYKEAKIQEISFYQELDKKDSKYYEENQKLKKFCPQYFGEFEKNDKKYVVLENLFYKMPYASSIDFKLGRQTYMPDHSPKKIEGEKKKSQLSTGESLGFRISGLQFKNAKGQITQKLYRTEAYYAIKEKDLESLGLQLLKSNESELNKEALKYYISKLQSLIEFFEKESTRFFIASSVFVLCDNISNKYSLNLIDFGHYDELKPTEKDENVLEGLRNVLKIFQNIQQKLG